MTVCMFGLPTVDAAINWDNEANTQWWFNPVNWDESSNSNGLLPGSTGTDANVSIGYGLNAEGVVYDPNSDPGYPPPGTIPFAPPFNATSIGPLNVSRRTATNNLITIKGSLTTLQVQVGRSSGIEGFHNTGTIRQLAGKVTIGGQLELGAPDASTTTATARGLGNGVYDYHGGTLEIQGSTGLRLSHGSTSNGTANDPNGNPYLPALIPTGTSGSGKFIMHNPASGGFVRAPVLQIASFAGITETVPVTTARDPDGINRGVGIFEFHFENGGTRPFQVTGNMSINNGFTAATGGTRSARLDLVMGENGCTGLGCVPPSLGLFEVNGTLAGTGDLDGDPNTNEPIFSSADDPFNTHYSEGSIVSATYGNTTFNWTISYEGEITWNDRNNSDVDFVEGSLGEEVNDIVLIGLSSSTEISADFDEDGDVTGLDFLIWQRNAGGAGDFFDGDTNNDGLVNGTDLATWESQYAVALQGIATVPEPASVLLMSLGLWAVAARRRR